MQHLIFPGRLAVEPDQLSGSDALPPPPDSSLLSSSLSQITTDLRELFDALPEVPPSAVDDPGAALALYNLLHALDPTVAARWHWRDTRKVLRNLEIMRETGRTVTDIHREQSAVTPTPR
jgi:tRNA dimethylallyltransferase